MTHIRQGSGPEKREKNKKKNKRGEGMTHQDLQAGIDPGGLHKGQR